MARIEYVGHATVVVDLDGVRLLTDPLLRNRVAHLRRAVPVDAKALRGLDALLISHASAPRRRSR
jgi:L-ascorbate metabolism protein UlaG (beta-lactamase superfamily)